MYHKDVVASGRRYSALAAVENPGDESRPSEPLVQHGSVAEQHRGNAISLLGHIQRLLQSRIGGSSVWNGVMAAAQQDLKSLRPRRIAVIGDRDSRARSVVTSLVLDPLVDNAKSLAAIANRQMGSGSKTLLVSPFEQSAKLPSVDRLEIPNTWLRVNGSEIMEVEVADGTQWLDCLATSDLAIIVVDGHRLASPYAQLLPSLHRVMFVVDGELPSSKSEEDVRATLAEQLSAHPEAVYFVRSTQAVEALHSLSIGLASHASPTADRKVSAFADYQDRYMTSGIEALRAHLTQAIHGDYQLATALAVAEKALGHAESGLLLDRKAALEVKRTISDLEQLETRAASRAERLSVASRGITGGMVEGGTDYAIQTSRSDVARLLQTRLSWLKMLGTIRFDDVGTEVAGLLSRFGSDLEKQLVFEAGQLAQVQMQLSAESDGVARRLCTSSGHPFSSPLLVNHLSSLSLSIPNFDSDTLLDPIRERRSQLVNDSAPRLHRKAQRALLSTFSLATFGVFNAWLIAVPPLSIISTPTAAAAGVVSVMLATLWGQRLWNNAQRAFWADYDRIVSMLRHDLSTRLEAAIQTRLVAKPKAAIEGLSVLLRRREANLDGTQSSIDTLRKQLHAS